MATGDIVGRIAGVIHMNLSFVVVWSRGILKFRCSIPDSVRGCVKGGFFGVVLGGCAVVGRCSVGLGVVNWSISVVF